MDVCHYTFRMRRGLGVKPSLYLRNNFVFHFQLAYGNSFGWISPALDVLKTTATPLQSGPLSEFEIGIVGSASSFGGFLTSFFYGWVSIL